MKWTRPVYYVVVSLVVIAFLLVSCISFPYLLIFTIPAATFLYLFPTLNKPDKAINALKQENEEKVNMLTSKMQQQSSAHANEKNAILAQLSAVASSTDNKARELNAELISENEGLRTALARIKAISEEQSKLLSQVVPEMTGVMYERYVGSRLAILGYTQIDYTPASGDFGADILAVDPDGRKACIQCKRYESTVGIEAAQQVVGGKAYYRCDRAIVITNSTFTPAAKEFAKNIDVELWERFV